MGGEGHAAVLGGQAHNLVHAYKGGHQQQVFLLPHRPILPVQEALLPENLRAVLDVGHILIDIVVELQGALQGFEQADHVGLLGGAQLHAGDDQQAVARPGLHGGGGVAAGVVVCQGDDVAAGEQGHLHQVVGGHVVVTARGKARMDVQIVVVGVHCSRL